MQFVVPQFIDVESKIIGPISARQFIIVLVTFGILYVEFTIFSFAFFIPIGLVTGSFGGALAFAKINGQMMHYFLLNLIQTLKQPRLKFWQRLEYVPQEKEKSTQNITPITVQKEQLTESRLAAMALMVDTGGAYASDDVRQRAKNPKPPIQ